MGKRTEIKILKLKHQLGTLETETEANMALLQISIEKSKSDNNAAISENSAAIERLRGDMIKTVGVAVIVVAALFGIFEFFSIGGAGGSGQ